MADQLPVNFAIPGENSIANYDWRDIATGTGYIEFYATKTRLASADSYKLVTSTLWSDSDYALGNNSATDLDFDITFDNQLTLKGEAHVQVPIAFFLGSGTGVSISCTVTVNLYKVSGGVETQIGSTATTTQSSSALNGGQSAQKIGAVVIAINTPTIIKRGDTLRLNVISGAGGGTNRFTGIFFNPANNTTQPGTWIDSIRTTQLKLSLPVRVND
jgi:hypothetical protein